MKLSDRAKTQGITYRTAWNWYKEGRLPVLAKKLPSGTIVVEVDEHAKVAAIYARVSSHDQKPYLDGQIARCLQFADTKGITVSQTVVEVGSGLNGHRKKLMRLLADPAIFIVIVEHRDRLMRFGAEYVEAALSARGAKMMVVDESELEDDLVQDMIAVLSSFCARLYGRRSAKNRAKKLLAACEADQ